MCNNSYCQLQFSQMADKVKEFWHKSLLQLNTKHCLSTLQVNQLCILAQAQGVNFVVDVNVSAEEKL